MDKPILTFQDYQQEAGSTDIRPSEGGLDRLIIPLLGIVGEVGSLAAEQKKHLREGEMYLAYKAKLREELGDMLWYMTALASDAGVSMEEVAEFNLCKTKGLYDASTLQLALEFDLEALYSEDERLPNVMEVWFMEDAGKKVSLIINGEPIGDPIKDNAYESDGYRYHDIFHIAFATYLGWSPVLRKLIHCKRKSNPLIDEVEDGGRAAVIEEAVSALVFRYAQDHSLLEGVRHLDSDLLQTIKRMVSHLEVAPMPPKLWEKAILKGFEVFRYLEANGGGKVIADRKSGRLEVVNQ